jgi:hypothetical protein
MERIATNMKCLSLGSDLKGKKVEIQPLTNFDILKLTKKIKNFGGVFMKDELPQKN